MPNSLNVNLLRLIRPDLLYPVVSEFRRYLAAAYKQQEKQLKISQTTLNTMK